MNVHNEKPASSAIKYPASPEESAKHQFQKKLDSTPKGSATNASLSDSITDFLSKRQIVPSSVAMFGGVKFNLRSEKGKGVSVLAVDLIPLTKKAATSGGHTPFVMVNFEGKNKKGEATANKYIGTYDGLDELAIGKALPDKLTKSIADKVEGILSRGIDQLPDKVAKIINKSPKITFANIRETLDGRDVTNLTDAEVEDGKRKGAFKTSLNIGIIAFKEKKKAKLDNEIKKADSTSPARKKGKPVPDKTIKAYIDILVKSRSKAAQKIAKLSLTAAEIATSLNVAAAPLKKITTELLKKGLEEGTQKFTEAFSKKLRKNIRQTVENEVKSTFAARAQPQAAYGLAIKFDLPQLTDFQRQELKTLAGLPADTNMAKGVIEVGKAVANVVIDKVDGVANEISETVNTAGRIVEDVSDIVKQALDAANQAKDLINDVANGIPGRY